MKFSRYNLEITNNKLGKTILFNTLTGHSFYIDENAKTALQNNAVDELDSETLELFRKYGVVIEDTIDERRFFSYYHNKSKFSSDAVSSTVLLTWACNFACIYCYEGAGASTEMMSVDQAERYIKFMKNLAVQRKAKTMYVNLFGGEPLVNIEKGFYILQELSEFCFKNKIDFSCGIITNGTLLSTEIIEKLMFYKCSMVQVTLDGLKTTHNERRPYKGGKESFDDVISAIERLSHYKELRTVVRINVDKMNLLETESLLEYLGCNNKNLTSCTVDFGIVRGSTAACSAYSGNCLLDGEIGDTLSHLWSVAEKNGFKMYTRPAQRWMYCGLYSDAQFTITPDGGVYKCWEHAGIEEHKIGTLDEKGNISDLQYAYFDWMTKNPLEDAECQECVYLPACGGGCGVISYNETKSYHAKGCFKVKGVIEKQIERYVIDMMKARNDRR